MFIASFSLTVLSVAMVAVVGVGNTGVFLLAAIIVDLSRMAFRYFHSRNKLKKLLNLKDKIDGKGLSQFSPEGLKYLMKSDDVSMEYLGTTLMHESRSYNQSQRKEEPVKSMVSTWL